MTEKVDWNDLEPYQKDEFTQLLHEIGLDVSVEEAKEYYGNKEKAIREARE